jgi:hypothetical protein
VRLRLGGCARARLSVGARGRIGRRTTSRSPSRTFGRTCGRPGQPIRTEDDLGPITGPPIAVDTGLLGRACDFLDPAVCLQPFPNDYFTTRDASTDTGRRLDVSALATPRNIAAKPIDPGDIDRNDGFSPGNLIVVHVPGLETKAAYDRTAPVPETDMARYAEPSAPVVVIDAATGRRWPIWTELDVNPKSDGDRNLIVRPARNWLEGHRYIVALRDLRNAKGEVLGASDRFRIYRDRRQTSSVIAEERRAHLESLFASLKDAGIARKDLYLTWDFTIASRRNLSERVLAMRNDAFAKLGDSNLADLKVQGKSPAFAVDGVVNDPDGPTGKIARVITGRVTVPCYLNLPACVSGSRFQYPLGPATGLPVLQPIPGNTTDLRFTCHIPRWALTHPEQTRASLYGHGLLGSRGEIGQGQLQNFGNNYGITFCATDWIGMACADLPDGLDFPPSTDPASYATFVSSLLTQAAAGKLPVLPNCDIPNIATILVDLSNFPTLSDRVEQGLVNQMYLGRAMIHPQGFNSDPAFQVNGHGVFDTTRLFYDGNSQGGIIGGALAALEPDLDRATLGVPGMNYSTLLRRSVDFDTYAQFLYQAYPDQLERPLILSIMQLMWDRAEANGFAQHMTDDPLPDTPPHHVILNLAFGDHQVANVAAETEARTIGAHARTPYVDAGRSPYSTTTPWGIPEIKSYPFDGSAIVMFDSGSPTPPAAELPPRAGADPHEHTRRTPEDRALKSAFLQVGGKVINPCPPTAGCKGFKTDPEG